jgi:hypothetical protein
MNIYIYTLFEPDIFIYTHPHYWINYPIGHICLYASPLLMLKVSQLYYRQYWYYNSIIDNYYIHLLICVYIYICTIYWYILLIYLYNIDISFWWLKNPQIGGFSPNPPGLHPDEFFEVTWPVAPPALRMPMDARRWTNHHGIFAACVWKLGGTP